MDDRTAAALRGLIIRGYVVSVEDDGEEQTLTVETHEGVTRSGIPVSQIYGLGGVPPQGSQVVLLAIGGDQGDMIALPPTHTGSRMGGFQAGERALYDDQGNRVAIYRGGNIEIVAAAKVRIAVPNVAIEAPAGVKITGDVEIVGNLKVNGSIEDGTGTLQVMRDQHNQHGHPGGGAAPPTVLMD